VPRSLLGLLGVATLAINPLPPWLCIDIVEARCEGLTYELKLNTFGSPCLLALQELCESFDVLTRLLNLHNHRDST